MAMAGLEIVKAQIFKGNYAFNSGCEPSCLGLASRIRSGSRASWILAKLGLRFESDDSFLIEKFARMWVNEVVAYSKHLYADPDTCRELAWISEGSAWMQWTLGVDFTESRLEQNTNVVFVQKNYYSVSSGKALMKFNAIIL